MRIGPHAVVTLDYTLRDDAGEVIDQSDGEPLLYLHGVGALVAGVEKALLGQRAGDHLDVDVSPEDGYGAYDSDRIIEINRDELPDDLVPEIGMELATEGPDGEPTTFWVVALDEERVSLDANHPLAGQTLHFSIDVRHVRLATTQEVEAGRPAG